MATKSLYELKMEAKKKKNSNMITDSDYFLRDKEEEARNGSVNTIDMTPVEVKPKVTVKKTEA